MGRHRALSGHSTWQPNRSTTIVRWPRLSTSRTFLKDFRELTAQHTRGCVIMERPDLLVAACRETWSPRHDRARVGHRRVERVTPRRSQYQPGDEIPERSFVYRWAKKYAFNDFGSYARHFEPSRYRDPDAVGEIEGKSAEPASDLPIVNR